MTDITCQFSAYLMYSDIFSLFRLKSCFDLNMAASCLSIISIRYQGVHKSEGYLPIEWKHLHHYHLMFVQSLEWLNHTLGYCHGVEQLQVMCFCLSLLVHFLNSYLCSLADSYQP